MTASPSISRLRTLVHCGLLAGVLTATTKAGAVSLTDWATLVSFRPDPAMQGKLQTRPADPEIGAWGVQKIERSRGALLLENTSLVITKMPAFEGKVADTRALLREIRLHLPQFFDSSQAALAPLAKEDEAALASPTPIGAVLHLSGATVTGKDIAYVVSESTQDHFILTSLRGGKAGIGINPFSGNREIGVSSALPLDGCILYSHAALRAAEAATPETEKALAAESSAIWQGAFARIRALVEKNGGAVVDGLEPQVSTLVSWNDVAKSLHQPKVAWQDMDGLWQSIEKEKRFAIQFHGLSAPAEFIERNRKGKELRIPVMVQVQVTPGPKGGTTYILERPNDSKDVLTFYEFGLAIQSDIIAAKPKPSRLALTRSGDKLKGEWQGLTISRDAAGRLAGIKQPGTVKGRIYEFKAEGP